MVSYSMHERKSGNRGGNAHGYMKRMARRELRRNGKQFVKEGLEFRSSDCLKQVVLSDAQLEQRYQWV